MSKEEAPIYFCRWSLTFKEMINFINQAGVEGLRVLNCEEGFGVVLVDNEGLSVFLSLVQDEKRGKFRVVCGGAIEPLVGDVIGRVADMRSKEYV